MKNIYIDSKFRCHSENTNGEYREFDVPFFYGKCAAFIEGYRFVPAEESWIRSDGVIFTGEMISPWKPYDELHAAQREYERAQLTQYKAELAELDAALLDVQYQSLIGGL